MARMLEIQPFLPLGFDDRVQGGAMASERAQGEQQPDTRMAMPRSASSLSLFSSPRNSRSSKMKSAERESAVQHRTSNLGVSIPAEHHLD